MQTNFQLTCCDLNACKWKINQGTWIFFFYHFLLTTKNALHFCHVVYSDNHCRHSQASIIKVIICNVLLHQVYNLMHSLQRKLHFPCVWKWREINSCSQLKILNQLLGFDENKKIAIKNVFFFFNYDLVIYNNWCVLVFK